MVLLIRSITFWLQEAVSRKFSFTTDRLLYKEFVSYNDFRLQVNETFDDNIRINISNLIYLY